MNVEPDGQMLEDALSVLAPKTGRDRLAARGYLEEVVGKVREIYILENDGPTRQAQTNKLKAVMRHTNAIIEILDFKGSDSNAIIHVGLLLELCGYPDTVADAKRIREASERAIEFFPLEGKQGGQRSISMISLHSKALLVLYSGYLFQYLRNLKNLPGHKNKRFIKLLDILWLLILPTSEDVEEWEYSIKISRARKGTSGADWVHVSDWFGVTLLLDKYFPGFMEEFYPDSEDLERF